MSILVFLQNNLGWILLAAIAVAAIGAVSLASPRARERGISNRIFVVAAALAVGALLAYGGAILATSFFVSPS